jgi:hypothetical protein
MVIERKTTNMKTVRVNNGRVEQFENGSIRRIFGSNIGASAGKSPKPPAARKTRPQQRKPRKRKAVGGFFK